MTLFLSFRSAPKAGSVLSEPQLFGGDADRPTRRALGFHGPRPRPAQGTIHAQIPDRVDYGHFDYLPPDDLGTQIDKQQHPIRFVAEVLTNLPHAWPS